MCPKDDGFALFNIEENRCLAVQPKTFPIFYLFCTCIDDSKIGLKVIQFVRGYGSNKHVGAEMLLPGHFVNESNFLAGGRGGTHVAIEDIYLLEGVEVIDSFVLQFIENLWRRCLIDIIPIYFFCRLGSGVESNKFIFGRATREFTSRHGEGGSVFCFGNNSFVVGLFVIEKLLVGHVPINCGWVCYPDFIDPNLFTRTCSAKSLRNIVRTTGLAIVRVINSGRCTL
mmetsp:Transcript_15437/g.35767  ORF Transcript_15437/g.35767 Transcript_15437/m.35767 type:complete len:227 (-) Transcript_15437:76-756(-)